MLIMTCNLPLFLLSSILLINTEVICSDFPTGFVARPLLPGNVYHCCKNEPYISRRDLPVIYCYLASPKVLFNTWLSVSALVDLSPDQYEVFEGRDVNGVMKQFEAHRSSWSLINLINFRSKETELNPFNNTCLGIRTNQDYNIKLVVTEVDYVRVTTFIVGVLLFLLSQVLSSNPFFYYLTGVTVGVSASVLILVYFLIKLLPMKKVGIYATMATGSTIAFYFFRTFYDMALPLAIQYQEYLIGYLVLSALISFVVCYRLGPVSNPRSKNLIKWSLQVFALIMIYMSSYLQEVTLAADVLILFFYYIPIFQWIASFGRLRPRQRLLTRDEYREQAEVETKRNLEQLRAYCNSPECRHWQTVLRLRDPHRFAKFMEGKSHLTKGEVEQYDEESKQMMDSMFTDDSETDED